MTIGISGTTRGPERPSESLRLDDDLDGLLTVAIVSISAVTVIGGMLLARLLSANARAIRERSSMELSE